MRSLQFFYTSRVTCLRALGCLGYITWNVRAETVLPCHTRAKVYGFCLPPRLLLFLAFTIANDTLTREEPCMYVLMALLLFLIKYKVAHTPYNRVWTKSDRWPLLFFTQKLPFSRDSPPKLTFHSFPLPSPSLGSITLKNVGKVMLEMKTIRNQQRMVLKGRDGATGTRRAREER